MFSWVETYETGIEEIDSIHKKILQEASKLFDGNQLVKDPEVIDQIIDKLIFYGSKHQESEVSILNKYDYPTISECKGELNKFISALKSYKIDIEEDINENISLDLLLFLKNWILCHLTIHTQHFKTHRSN